MNINDYEWIIKPWTSLVQRLPQLPHALLLHGPRGVGKLALATSFAQLLLCEAPGVTVFCGACDGCRWFRDSNHPDFRLVQPEILAQESDAEGEPVEAEAGGKKAKPSSEIKVDQVRALGDFLYVGSHRGARRVALIHPAETMNANAANALLKALEEPPANAVFLLVSHEPARLLATVRSRCSRVAVPLPPFDLAMQWLASQGVKDPGRWLAYAGGAPLLAAELATGPACADIVALLEAMERGNFAGVSVNSRETIGLLAGALQRGALDRAFVALAGRSKYGNEAGRVGSKPGLGAEWLSLARDMGRNRRLAERPLNVGLFSTELMTRYSELDKHNGKN